MRIEKYDVFLKCLSVLKHLTHYNEKKKVNIMKNKKQVILDTNIFVKLDEENIDPNLVKSRFKIFSSNAQLSEILADKNHTRKESRTKYYHSLSPVKLKLESGVWIDKLIWDDDQIWQDNPSATVENIRGNSNKSNTWIDAMIAEVAKLNNLILVTHEAKIRKRAIKNGISVLDYNQFIDLLNS